MILNRSMQKVKTKGGRQGGASDGITGKANPTKEAKARRPRKAGGGESTRRGEKEKQLRTGSRCRRKETEPEQTGRSPKGTLEDTGQFPGTTEKREEKQTGESRGYKDQERNMKDNG